MRSLGVFCGSSSGSTGRHVALARELGQRLASDGVELVYGGGEVGLMGELADACLAGGGRVVGVIPVGLFSREVAHRGVTELHEVASMHERKQLMYERSEGFLALPGGLGTLEELAEVVTWSQLGLHAKPLVLVDTEGFWSGLIAQLDHMVAEGFLRAENRALVRRAESVDEALDRVAEPLAPGPEKWIGPDER